MPGDATHAVLIVEMWPDPASNEAQPRWVQEYDQAIAAHFQDGMDVTFATADDQPKVVASHGSNYPRFRAVKGRHCPGKVCHLNQNIQPGG